MNKLIIRSFAVGAAGVMLLSSVAPVLAVKPAWVAERREDLRGDSNEGTGAGLLLRRESTESGKPEGTGSGILERLEDLLFGKRAVIVNGVLSALSGTTIPATLTVTKNGKSYSVLVDGKTQLRRRFWGKSTLSEMNVGDNLNVIGKWTDNAKTTIQATLVRDLSVQKRSGVFFGTVSSLSANGWVMSTVRRGNQTVTVSSSTNFINRSGQTITQADIKVGDRVRVRGLWDNIANTITEVTQVKDYSLPAQSAQ